MASVAERLTADLHATPRFDDTVLKARRLLSVGEAELSTDAQRRWLRDSAMRDALFATAGDALRDLGLPPLTAKLYVNHWIACFLRYPRYLRDGFIDLAEFRLPKNALARMRDYAMSRDDRFSYDSEDALVIPAALGVREIIVDGQRQPLVMILDASNYPNPEDARTLLRSPVGEATRRDWLRDFPPLVTRRAGRPRRSKGSRRIQRS